MNKVKRLYHKWKQTRYQPGYKQETCQVCGAIREDFNMYIKYAGRLGRHISVGSCNHTVPDREGNI